MDFNNTVASENILQNQDHDEDISGSIIFDKNGKKELTKSDSDSEKRCSEQHDEASISSEFSDEGYSTLSSPSISQSLQLMKERLNLSNSELTNHSLNSSYLSFHTSLDVDESLEDFSVSSENTFENFYAQYRNEEIQKELKLVKIHHQDGVYIIPSLKSIEVWFGVMFIRDGPYKDGIFHFSVNFPDDFPDGRPALNFKSNIFHPQIKPNKGTLNLNPLYAKSTKKSVRVWEIIKYARSCFYHLDVHEVNNVEAALFFATDYNKFKARCRSSVLDSLLVYEEQKNAIDFQSENPFRCSLVDDDLCEAIKNVLLSSEQENGEKQALFGWAKNQLGKVINNIYSLHAKHKEKVKGDDPNDSLM